ncbi:MAG: radical SAM protein [Promethearchaeota archaeon]
MEVTLRCNGKCPFCAIHSLPKNYIENEMTTEQIIFLIDQLAEFGINTLSLTGGEPTLRKDLPELIYHMGVKHNFINGITSNGFLLPKLLPKLEGLDFILTSLDYPTAELHDKFRGIKVFDKVIEAINLANKRDIKVIISTVVMKDNLHLLEDICKIAEDLNCTIELYPCEDIIWDINGKNYRVENIQEMIPDLHIWANKIRALRTKFKNILTDTVSLEIIEKGGFGGTPYHQKTLRCHVAEAYMFIRHNGVIDYPCKIHPKISFDTLNHTISKIYRCKEARDIMKKNDDYQFCDGCRLGCAITSSIPTKLKTCYAKYVRGYLNGNLR